MPLVHGQDARPENFSHIGGAVQSQGYHARYETVNGYEAKQQGPGQLNVVEQTEVDDGQLYQQGSGAEQSDVCPGDCLDKPIFA